MGATSFLTLPRELRDIIYDYALKIDGQVMLQAQRVRLDKTTHDFEGTVLAGFSEFSHWTPGNTSFLDDELKPADNVPTFNLLRACKQIYHEGVELLYGSNTFTVFSRRIGADGNSSHFGVVESLQHQAMPILTKWIRPNTLPLLKHVTMHIHSWPFFKIPTHFLYDVIMDSRVILVSLPAVQNLRVIVRVSTNQNSLLLDNNASDEQEDVCAEVIRAPTVCHDEHVGRLAKWLAKNLAKASLQAVSDKLEIRLMHTLVEEPGDATILTQALRCARDEHIGESLNAHSLKRRKNLLADEFPALWYARARS